MRQADSADLAPEIARKIEEGSQLSLLCHQRGGTLQIVDFLSEIVREAYITGTYQIMISPKILASAKQDVVCLFPNHRVEKKQVIKASDYSYLSSLNKDINAAFSASLEKTDSSDRIKFAVCYGKHVFVCKDITGTVYLAWASHINRTNTGNVANTIHTNVPIILNLDGQARFKALFILKPVIRDETELDRVPITRSNPQLLYNKDQSIFVCEVRTERPVASLIKTVSRKEALAFVSATTKSDTVRIKREKNPFASSVDMEEDVGYMTDGRDVTFSYGSGPDVGTPRSALYLREGGSTALRPVSVTPPIIRSDGECATDPFVEDEDDDGDDASINQTKREEIV